ncbi:MAG: amidohydrolase family protein [Proteobacteria bacterium]|nr:amidohydrolase family protein [Pseudomonadota bacterium]MDA0957719.1 amidohydrolase family protein [Pseudomonadota bacterium]MDA1206308.1 amidohydrolase family protein [Pseudomonadota bacterium]
MMKRILLIGLGFIGSLAAADEYWLTNAKLATGPDGIGVIRDIHVKNGRIEALGQGLKVGLPAKVIDLKAALVTPGFIDSATTIGLAEVSGLGVSQDGEVADDDMAAGFRVGLALNDASVLIPVASNDGITRGVVVPEPGDSNFAGISALVRFQRGEGFIVSDALAQHLYLREWDRRHAGGSRASALASVVHALEESARFDQQRRDFNSRKYRAFEMSAADLQALSEVRTGRMKLVAHVDRAADIRHLIAALEDFPEIRLVLAGATEAWKVSKLLAAKDIPVLLSIMNNLPENFDRLGARLDHATLLDADGVQFAFMSGSPYSEFRSLSQAAGVAVAYGLSWTTAIAAITRSPAQIWGLEDLGVIEPGAIADLVIWDGDPLEVTSAPTAVMIDGAWVDLSTRHKALAERYRDLLDLK